MRITLYLKKIFSKISRRYLAGFLILFLLFQPFYPILPGITSKVSANSDIQAAKKDEEAMFVNVNPDFKVEFGSKSQETKHRVRFEAVSSEDNPFANDTTAQIVENQKNLLERLAGKVKKEVKKANPFQKKRGIEFSLVKAEVEEGNGNQEIVNREWETENRNQETGNCEWEESKPSDNKSAFQFSISNFQFPNNFQFQISKNLFFLNSIRAECKNLVNKLFMPVYAEEPGRTDLNVLVDNENEPKGNQENEGNSESASKNSDQGDETIEQDNETENLDQQVQSEKSILEELKMELRNMVVQTENNGKKAGFSDEEIFQKVAGAKTVYAKTELSKIDGHDQVKNPEAIPGVDVEYAIDQGKGVKEDIVIKEKRNFTRSCVLQMIENPGLKIDESRCSLPQNTFVFDLSLDKDVALKSAIGGVGKTPGGTYYFTDQDGNYLFHFLPLLARDANGIKTNAVKMNIDPKSDPGQYQMKVSVDLSWLLDPQRAYPIKIDPSIVHDTEVEFDGGSVLNRVESINGPKVQTSQPSLTMDGDAVALWHLDEMYNDSCSGGQDACDAGGNYHGTATGTTIANYDKKIGSASRLFNGTSDFVEVSADAALEPDRVTVEAWIKINKLPSGTNYDGIVGNRAGSYDETYHLSLADSTAQIRFMINTSGASGGRASAVYNYNELNDEGWHYVVGTYDGSNVKLYVDGELKDTAAKSSATLFDAGNPVHIGKMFDGTTNYYFDGLIDEVRISDVALSAEQIEVNYNMQKFSYGTYVSSALDLGSVSPTLNYLQWTENGVQTGEGEIPQSSTDLVAQWNFNETSGTTAANNAGAGTCGGTASNCDLTLNNFASTGSQDADGLSGWTANKRKWGAGGLMLSSAATADLLSVSDVADGALDPNASDFTIETWIKTADVSAEIFSNNNNNGTSCTNSGYYLGIDASGYPVFKFDDNGATAGCDIDITGGVKIHFGDYHFLTVSVSRSAGAVMYLDGKVIQSDSSDTSAFDLAVTGNIYIGGSSGGFDGTIDSTRFYERALSANEIFADYQAGNIEFQTRTGSDSTPDNGGWEVWKPSSVGAETQLLSLDADQSNWSWDSEATYMQKTETDDSVIKQEGSGSMALDVGRPQVDANTVGLWHLDETSGTGAYIHDSSGNGYDCTPTGTTAVGGLSKTAQYYDGSDYIDCPADTYYQFGGSNFTAEAWVNLDYTDLADIHMFFGTYYPSQYKGWYVGVNAGIFRANISTNGSSWNVVLADTSRITAGKWYHLALKREGDAWNLYVNGKSVDSASVAGSIVDSDDSFDIGENFSTYRVHGKIDEVKISNVARTNEEILEVARAGFGHQLSRTISSTDFSAKSKIPFYIASDQQGTYIDATVGESTYANNETDANTIGLWRFDETATAGLIKDYSSTGNDGTATGTTYVEGKIGKGRKFNGSSDHISAGTYAASASGTVSAWIKPSGTSYAANQTVLAAMDSGGTAANSRYRISMYNTGQCSGSWHTVMPNSGQYACSGMTYNATNFPAGVWTFLVVTYDGTTIKFYKDGVEISEVAQSASAESVTAIAFEIGRLGAYNGHYFSGSADEARISNSARSADAIRQLYESGKRTHPISIDFAANLDSGNLIADSDDHSFTIDATGHGLSSMGAGIYHGEKVIVRENVDGTEYIAQGTLDSITPATGVATVYGWDSGSTFPASGYTASATAFKWQREYWDITGALDSHVNAITNMTLRFTGNAEGRTIWLDDFETVSNYLTAPSAVGNISSSSNQYLQYRAIFSTTNLDVNPYLSSATIDYTEGGSASPTNDLLMRHGKWFSSGQKQGFWWSQ